MPAARLGKRLYRDELGFRPQVGAFAKEASRLALMGTPGAQYRVTSAPVPVDHMIGIRPKNAEEKAGAGEKPKGGLMSSEPPKSNLGLPRITELLNEARANLAAIENAPPNEIGTAEWQRKKAMAQMEVDNLLAQHRALRPKEGKEL